MAECGNPSERNISLACHRIAKRGGVPSRKDDITGRAVAWITNPRTLENKFYLELARLRKLKIGTIARFKIVKGGLPLSAQLRAARAHAHVFLDLNHDCRPKKHSTKKSS